MIVVAHEAVGCELERGLFVYRLKNVKEGFKIVFIVK
jgi:hypothetical protein